MVEAAQITRYERVKQILDRAAEGATADYDGHPQFWNLPLPEFLDVEIYGIRMIAPAPAEETPTHSCCHATPTGEPATKRSAQSGLIKGLRGAAPFDGNQYPRLLWGGKTVSHDDISFIAEWIDDGCPDQDRQTSFPVEGTIKTSKETVEATNVEPAARTFDVYDSPNEYAYKHGELKQRMNLDCMSATEIEKFRWAFRELYNLNKWTEDRRSYNNMALIHQNHCQHGWERFLPWHRIYLYEFEQTLQDVCPGVTMPYWDFTMPQYCPEKPENGDIIPLSYKAYLTNESLEFLKNAEPSLPAPAIEELRKGMVDEHKRYPSQQTFFNAVAKLTDKKYTVDKHRERFIDALLAANSLWYPLRYPSEFGSGTMNTVIRYHYPTAADIIQILSLRTFRDFGGGSFYDDSFGFLDQNPHNTMHIWTGGQNPTPETDKAPEGYAGTKRVADLAITRNSSVRVAGRRPHSRDDLYSQPTNGDMFSNLTASFDPIFWPIHSNIDRIWHEWQTRNPHALPLDLDAVLTPWSYTIADTLNMARFGYEYVKCAFVIPVGIEAPVGRFVSKPIGLPEAVRSSFEQAEVRLHRVPQLPRSCFIRVFLNLPDANASTSIEDAHYAGYLAIFGHADCIGGPGHCDLPPSQPRKYDQRPRHHNTPRNHRVNVTKTAKKLIDEGATSLQITLVVIGADYCEDSDLLRLNSVSLDFLD